MPVLRRAKLLSYTLALALGLSAQAAGAVHFSVLVGYAALVVVSAMLALPLGGTLVPRFSMYGAAADAGKDGSKAQDWRKSIGIGVWFALASFCLLQVLPLPMRWLEVLAPDNADIWARSLRPFGVGPPAFGSISLAPHRTILEALKFASYGIVFGVSAQLARQLGVRCLARIVFGSALAVAMVTAAHQLLGAERLWGVYRPIDAADVAPLLNPNSRAGYLNLGFFCGLGLLFRSGERPRAALLGLGMVFIVAEILLCQSRGGTGCLITGMLLVLALRRGTAGSRDRLELGRVAQVGVVVLIATSGALLVLSARQRGGLGFGDQSLEKLDLITRAIRLTLDHVAVGVGRGAFGSVFSAYQSTGRPTVYEYAENFPLQWAAEWGLPATLAAFSALLWALWPTFSRHSLQSPVRRCVLVGCLVLLAQNLVDLGLEIPAVGAAFACLLGALCGGAPNGKRPSIDLPGRVLGAGSLLTIACLGLALLGSSDSPARERDRLRAELAASKSIPTPAFWAGLRRAVEAYPADPYFPLLGSTAALGARQNALPWAARALERGPESGQAHMQLAMALQAQGATDQALGALRRATLLDRGQADAALQLALRWAPTAILEMVPEGQAGADVLRMLAEKSRDSAQRVHWLEAALERSPKDPELHYQLAYELFRDLIKKDAGVLCRERKAGCLDAVLAHAAQGERPGSSRAAVLKAWVMELQSEPTRAEAELADVCAQLPSDVACADELAALAIKNGSPRLPSAVSAQVALRCGTRESCGQVHMSLGDQFAAAGQWQSAASHYRQATQEAPSAKSWRALAEASQRLGQPVRAEDALRRAELLDSKHAAAE